MKKYLIILLSIISLSTFAQQMYFKNYNVYAYVGGTWIKLDTSLIRIVVISAKISYSDTLTKIATWKYVGDHAGSTYTASNGLTKVVNDFQLGGNFSSNVDIYSNEGKSFYLRTFDHDLYEGSIFGDTTRLLLYKGKDNDESYVEVGNNQLKFAAQINTDKSEMTLDAIGGLKYINDCSGNYTSRSLVDSAFVKKAILALSPGSNDTAKYIKVINSTGGETPYYYKGIYSRQVNDVAGYLNDLTITNRIDSIVFSILTNGMTIKWGGGTTILNSSLSTGRGIFTDTIRSNKALDIKGPIKTTNQIKTGQYSAALTDGVPTDAEIDAATSLTPSTAGAGWQCFIKDSNGTGLVYRVYSDGTDWYYVALTKAL